MIYCVKKRKNCLHAVPGEGCTITITQIKYFLTAAKYCNFRKASAELYIAQQVLSKQIKVLENEIGVLLFERSRQRVVLTEAGKYMVSVWTPFIDKTEEALHFVRQMNGTGLLRIGVPDVNGVVEKILSLEESGVFSGSGIEVEILSGSVNQLLDWYRKKEIDMLILFSVDLQNIQRKGFCLELLKMQFGVIASKNHPLAKKRELHFSDLNGEMIFIFDDSYARNVEQYLLSDFQKGGIFPGGSKLFHDWKNMELSLALGKGIAITYKFYMPHDSKHLVFLPLILRGELPDTYLSVLWSDPRYSEVAEKLKNIFEQ